MSGADLRILLGVGGSWPEFFKVGGGGGGRDQVHGNFHIPEGKTNLQRGGG